MDRLRINPEESIDAYKQMLADNCSAIIGYEYLSDLLLVQKEQTNLNIPIFTTYSSSLKHEHRPKNIISFIPNYEYLALQLLNYMASKPDFKNILIISDVSRDEMIRYKEAYVYLLRKKHIQTDTVDFVNTLDTGNQYLAHIKSILTIGNYKYILMLVGSLQGAEIIDAINDNKYTYLGTENFGSSVEPSMLLRLNHKNINGYIIRNLDFEKPYSNLTKFKAKYFNEYKVSPTILSVYAFDAVTAILLGNKNQDDLLTNIYKLNTKFISNASIKNQLITKSPEYVILKIDKSGYHLEK